MARRHLNAIDATSIIPPSLPYAPCHLSDDDASPSAASAAAARAASAEPPRPPLKQRPRSAPRAAPRIRAAAARSLTSIAWFMSTQSKDA